MDATRLGAIAATAAAYAGLSFASLHILDPATDAVGRAGSEYVLGPYGPVMIGVFLAIAVAFVSLAEAMRRSLGARVIPGLLALAAGLMVVSSIFPTDRGVIATTVTGTIHNTAGLVAFICALVSSIAFARAAARAPRFAEEAGRLRWLSAALVLAFVASFATAGPLAWMGVFGLGQRLLVAAMIAWLIGAGLALRLGRRPILETLETSTS